MLYANLLTNLFYPFSVIRGGFAMTEAITKTQPLPDGSMLWCVHHKGSYFDNDPRGSGNVPIDVRSFVLAQGIDDAKKKAASLPSVKAAIAQSDSELAVVADIVTIESLVPARDSSEDGRMGWTSSSNLRLVNLEHPDDSAWRLAVCLVPVE
jgi:hypothetical protein